MNEQREKKCFTLNYIKKPYPVKYSFIDSDDLNTYTYTKVQIFMIREAIFNLAMPAAVYAKDQMD